MAEVHIDYILYIFFVILFSVLQGMYLLNNQNKRCPMLLFVFSEVMAEGFKPRLSFSK